MLVVLDGNNKSSNCNKDLYPMVSREIQPRNLSHRIELLNIFFVLSRFQSFLYTLSSVPYVHSESYVFIVEKWKMLVSLMFLGFILLLSKMKEK